MNCMSGSLNVKNKFYGSILILIWPYLTFVSFYCLWFKHGFWSFMTLYLFSYLLILITTLHVLLFRVPVLMLLFYSFNLSYYIFSKPFLGAFNGWKVLSKWNVLLSCYYHMLKCREPGWIQHSTEGVDIWGQMWNLSLWDIVTCGLVSPP